MIRSRVYLPGTGDLIKAVFTVWSGQRLPLIGLKETLRGDEVDGRWRSIHPYGMLSPCSR